MIKYAWIPGLALAAAREGLEEYSYNPQLLSPETLKQLSAHAEVESHS
jgi:hypothetical protein